LLVSIFTHTYTHTHSLPKISELAQAKAGLVSELEACKEHAQRAQQKLDMMEAALTHGPGTTDRRKQVGCFHVSRAVALLSEVLWCFEQQRLDMMEAALTRGPGTTSRHQQVGLLNQVVQLCVQLVSTYITTCALH